MQNANPLELTFTLQLLVLLVAAAIGSELAKRAKTSALVGQLVGGIALGVIFRSTGHQVILPLRDMGTFGILLLLFSAGLQMDLRTLLRAGAASTVVATCGVILPLAGGIALGKMFGYGLGPSLFAGATLVATSVAITVELLRELNMITSPLGTLIIGAAVVDDVLGIFILSMFAGMAKNSISVARSLLLVAAAVAFFALSFVLVGPLLRRVVDYANGLNAPRRLPDGSVKMKRRRRLVYVPEAALFAGLVMMLAYSIVAQMLSLAMITGAFLAGLLIGDTPLGPEIHKKFNAMGDALFYPLFFLILGMDFDPGAFLTAGWFAVALIAIAVVTKIVGCGMPAKFFGLDPLSVGVCMIPRGEVGLIVAKIGYDSGIINSAIYSAALVMVVATTVLTPPLAHLALSRHARKGEPPAAPPSSQ